MHPQEKLLIGWKEWCALSKLKIPAMKVKIDTGAKTSALHAENIKLIHHQTESFVSFQVYPLQNNTQIMINCEAKIIDERMIMSSNGQKEHRYIIQTPITLGNKTWDIELSLSNRDPLKFRMLLGREALKGMVMIDPEQMLCQGRILRRKLRGMYKS